MMNATSSSRRLLVTGATGGIGRAICQVLLQQELHVALAASRPSAELAQLTAELNGASSARSACMPTLAWPRAVSNWWPMPTLFVADSMA